MINIGINDGDLLIVEQCSSASNRDIVVALIDDGATVKRYFKENGHIRLQPENDYKHKLCPEISPKKTVEGFFGGIAADVIFMVIFALIYSLIAHAHVHYLWLIFIGIVCAVISVLGDLSASVLKRQQGIKDFGNIMPGHGGVMDRFDSVLFTVPAFYALEMMYPVFFG